MMDPALCAALPGLAEASNGIVHEVLAESWGYGGLSQTEHAAAEAPQHPPGG